MEYGELVGVYEDLVATDARLEKTSILADALQRPDGDLLVPVVRLVRGTVFEPWESGDLGIASSLTVEAISRATGIESDRLENWWREAGDLGDATARAVRENSQATLVSQDLTVQGVHDTLRSLATYEGPGSRDRRVGEIAGLINDAEPLEAKYLVRTVVGAMRLGVGEGLLRDAIASAFLDGTDADADAVKRAYAVTNDFSVVAIEARSGGCSALADLQMQLFRPVKPMLAQRSEDLATAMADLADESGTVLLETKYDGMRAKLHRDGDEISLYTRRLEDVTAQFPRVVEAAGTIDLERFAIEAEIVGFDPDSGKPVPFQDLSRRIKRKHDIQRLAEEIPVQCFTFDLLFAPDGPRLEDPLRNRLDTLEAALPDTHEVIGRADHRYADDLETAKAFRRASLEAGHEGLMVKNLAATYEPGNRVGYQQKVKRTLDPLDLVVTRAKWSEGRKSDFLGRPYLATRDEAGRLREVGRMHTGFTDEQLEEFTEMVEPLIESVDGREAELRPEVVLEVECAEIQESPKYDSGYALRFPRLKRIRPDLGVEDVDSLDRIVDLYENQ